MMMRRLLFALGVWSIAATAAGAPRPDCAASPLSPDVLRLYSTTDTAVFAPVLADFRRLHPDLAVCYVELEAAPLYERFRREADARVRRADVLLSSAMDLQVKLVNDGYAAPYFSESAGALPKWASWRHEAFGITLEPAVMVFNRKAMKGRPIPRSRQELVALLKRDPERWYGRIGTYDIVHSSVGYLLASQDARQGNESGALVEAFNDAGMQLEQRTGDLLDRLESGDLAIGYNLLGSYAQNRIAAGADLTIVYPQDYTLAVSRTVVLPENAPNPAAARQFLDYLLSVRGQKLMAERGLPAIRNEIQGRNGRLGISDTQVGLLRPIALGPGLLVYLDKQKRERLLSSWRAVIEAPSR
jgi:iron(III) transport system substrate-binding protein